MLMSLFLYGCSQEELIAEQEETQEVYTVSLKFNGDIQTEESPLSRAETDSRDLYGIQVYRDGKYFAAGMFDNTNDITINLLAGSRYKFVCTAIKEGKDKCYFSSSYGYCLDGPFHYSASIIGSYSNTFLYSTSYAMYDLDCSYIYDKKSNRVYSAKIDRFYGELENYTPSVDGIVNLELKRVSFGIKLKVSNITDGNVSVKCYNINSTYNTFVDVSGITSDYESTGEIFSMANVYDAWQYASSYTEDIKLDVVWNRGVGVTQSWTKTFQVKRNAMNTIRVKLGEDEYDSGVGVTPEGGDMGSEEEEIPLG